MAFKDPRAREAKELMVRLLRDKVAYETLVFPDNNFLVSAAVFPYFYGLVGDRNPRQAPKAGARSGYSPLAIDAFLIVQKRGPISKQRLRESLWAATSPRPRSIVLSTSSGPSCASPASTTSTTKASSGTCSSAGRPKR